MAGILSDDLTRPLGQQTEPVRATAAQRVRSAAVLTFGIVIAAVSGWIAFTRDPLGGEPFAMAAIDRSARSEPAQRESAIEPGDASARDEPARRSQRLTAQDAEAQSGVKVTRMGEATAPGSVIIKVPEPAQPVIRLAAAPDRRLIERGRHGPLPKIASDGSRPSDVYARPLPAAHRTAKIRVAIVVGGLGISGSATMDAIARLPDAVTLAFAPYGGELDRHVARAREDGHEILLQAPMEPFDYPDNDPGPQTLLTSLAPEQNIDRLHWLLSRFSGFVGVTNFMGAKFTANDASLAPVMQEMAQRGLLYLDDGSSARSLATVVASGTGVHHGRAEIVLDSIQKSADIDAALAKLETMAREKGRAIGFASALPVTVERIARWAVQAETRGITLVPVSALMAQPRRS